jgi:hypothetical protein
MMGLNWAPWLRMPASGDVWQKVTNVTDWFSPKVEMNFAGDPQIEQEVNTNVASYGKQLGLLTEAVIGLADPGDAGAQEALKAAVTRLKAIQGEVEAIKKRRAPDIEEQALQAMTRLKTDDAAAYGRVMERLTK